MTATILPSHRSRPAYVYLRQSTVAQVQHNCESTERQYAFKDKALQLGWAEPMIRVLDGDLGVSGAHTAGRDDFKTLVADVSMGKVGAVFALEASRLARSCADWHRLRYRAKTAGNTQRVNAQWGRRTVNDPITQLCAQWITLPLVAGPAAEASLYQPAWATCLP